jgi:hypothetical protein
VDEFLKEEGPPSLFKVFLLKRVEDLFAFIVPFGFQIPDGLIGLVFVLLLFKGHSLKLLLQFLVKFFGGSSLLVGHLFVRKAII